MDSLRDLRAKMIRMSELLGRAAPTPELAAVAAAFNAKRASFEQTDAGVRAAMTAFRKESPEADVALQALAKSYDSARDLYVARVPGVVDPGAASTHSTDVESIDAALVVADELGRADASWAGPSAQALTAAIQRAEKEVADKARAYADVQKAQAARAVAAHEAEQELLIARRLIRRAYGERSREYASVRDRNLRAGAEEPEPTPAAGGGAPAGAT